MVWCWLSLARCKTSRQAICRSSKLTSGQDAKVQEQLSSIRAAAEMYFSNTGGYGALPATVVTCTGGMFSDPLLSSLVAATPNLLCGANATTWTAGATLSTGKWCVDSSGVSSSSTPTLSGGTFKCV